MSNPLLKIHVLAPMMVFLIGCAVTTPAESDENGSVRVEPAGKTEKDFRIRDPFVLVDDGRYYLYESKPWSGGNGVGVRVSGNLVDWTAVKPVMKMPSDVKVRAVWAPEVHKYNGRYWLFVTITEKKGVREIKAMNPEADPKGLAPRGTWVFSADSPMGPFEPVKKSPVPPAHLQTLDGTLYVEDGRPYMVYCHEWCQNWNGTIEYAPLADDFASFTGPSVKMLDAQSSMEGAWVITDGPFFHRSEKSGRLYMIWSNVVKGKGYCVLVRSSASGRIAGPWSRDEILYGRDGGHGMIFRDLDGKLRLTIHQPNSSPDERMKLFTLEDDGEKLSL